MPSLAKRRLPTPRLWDTPADGLSSHVWLPLAPGTHGFPRPPAVWSRSGSPRKGARATRRTLRGEAHGDSDLGSAPLAWAPLRVCTPRLKTLAAVVIIEEVTVVFTTTYISIVKQLERLTGHGEESIDD